MNWRKWKIGLIVAGFTGLLNGVLFLAVDMTAKQIAILLVVNFAKDALLYLKQHNIEAVSFDTETRSNLSFKIWISPSLTIPHTNWQVITQFNSLETNTYTLTNGTNIYTVRVPVWYGAQFYTATATDSFWGESFFSNVAWTNPLPRTDNPLILSR